MINLLLRYHHDQAVAKMSSWSSGCKDVIMIKLLVNCQQEKLVQLSTLSAIRSTAGISPRKSRINQDSVGSSWKGSERTESTRLWNKALIQKERLKRNSRIMKKISLFWYLLSLTVSLLIDVGMICVCTLVTFKWCKVSICIPIWKKLSFRIIFIFVLG